MLRRDEGVTLLLQQIRDEAHRFAIMGHRSQRGKSRRRSVLEDIDGIGPVRRKRLLNRFGSLAGMRAATIDEIAGVQGVGPELAAEIFARLHSE